jgi:hypothetical protein
MEYILGFLFMSLVIVLPFYLLYRSMYRYKKKSGESIKKYHALVKGEYDLDNLQKTYDMFMLDHVTEDKKQFKNLDSPYHPNAKEILDTLRARILMSKVYNNKLKELALTYPNDADLGNHIRNTYTL